MRNVRVKRRSKDIYSSKAVGVGEKIVAEKCILQ